MRFFHICSDDWSIAKVTLVRRMRWKATVSLARPGRNKTEAWANFCDVTKVTKREAIAAGWGPKQLWVEHAQ